MKEIYINFSISLRQRLIQRLKIKGSPEKGILGEFFDLQKMNEVNMAYLVCHVIGVNWTTLAA